MDVVSNKANTKYPLDNKLLQAETHFLNKHIEENKLENYKLD